MGEQEKPRAYWYKGVYFLDGQAWGTFVPKVGEVKSSWLGKEEEIKPVLDGQVAMPANLSAIQRQILEEILEEEGIGKEPTTERGVERRRTANPLGNKEGNAGHPATRQRVSSR